MREFGETKILQRRCCGKNSDPYKPEHESWCGEPMAEKVLKGRNERILDSPIQIHRDKMEERGKQNDLTQFVTVPICAKK